MRITRVYTRVGDRGTTRLIGGGEVAKDDARIEAYGTVDELNSALGLARAFVVGDSDLDAVLADMQNDLFVLGSDLATPRRADKPDKPHVMRMASDKIDHLEALIDRCDEDLEPLTNFVLPGGTSCAAQIHLARTICRRAERLVVALSESGEDIGDTPVTYLNRLSDALFAVGRWANHRAGHAEVIWKP